MSKELLIRAKPIAEQMVVDGVEIQKIPTDAEGIHVTTNLDLIVPLGGFELNGQYFYIGLPKK